MPAIFLLLALLFNVFSANGQQERKAVDYVNPFIGTGGHGHTFPGATLPFGMVQLSPDTRIDGSWDGCGGYHYSDSLIYGFSHTHLSGTGVSDYGDVMIQPASAKKITDPKAYALPFNHSTEKAEAGYYKVLLEKDNIQVELTASLRGGMHKYTYPAKAEHWLVLDNNHRDKLMEGNIEQLDAHTLRGFRRSDAWATNQVVYYYMEFSEAIEEFDLSMQALENGRYAAKLSQSVWIKFKKGKAPLLVKVGISAVDYAGAKRNLEDEIPGWDFEKTRQEAKDTWSKALRKIEVSGGTNDSRSVFYTALYHTMVQPNTFSDADGRYRGHDFQIHQASHTVYTVFSLWDTFRAQHPLLTLLDKERTSDFIKTFLLNYEQGGRLPVWELAANETDCMIGYHSVSVIADAMVKGVRGFNEEQAFTAAKNSAMQDHLGLAAYKEKGYIELDDEPESVSKTLEYAFDDWSIAQIALRLNKKEEYNYFKKRSASWLNLLDPSTNNMRPRTNGGWLNPFEAREVNNHYTEGNSWQYSFFVPHQLPTLIRAQGGAKKFAAKLDELFTTNSETTGREQVDITGLLGQYAHGNEPSHHMAYLYNYVGQAYKTQEKIETICTEFYKNAPDGLIGNEDCGQMSAWYVFSAMGFYPTCPGNTSYALGTPQFDTIRIHLNEGKEFTISAKRDTPNAIYTQRVVLDGAELAIPFIEHRNLIQNSELSFKMGSEKPKVTLGPKQEDEAELVFFQAPSINAKEHVFDDSLKVQILAGVPYKLSISNIPLRVVLARDTSFYIKQTSSISAQNMLPDTNLLFAKANFYKRPNNWTISYTGQYNPQYNAGGDLGLIDGLHGDENWRKGRWQGFQDQDFEAIIDLKKPKLIEEIGAGFLQDTRSWIVFPKEVVFETSLDGFTWEAYGNIPNAIQASDYTTQFMEFISFKKLKARYVKVKAQNYGKLPEWHAGFGFPAFIFIDEIRIK